MHDVIDVMPLAEPRFIPDMHHPQLTVAGSGHLIQTNKTGTFGNQLAYAVGNTLLSTGCHYFEFGKPDSRHDVRLGAFSDAKIDTTHILS
jgi:hypothetical protein